MSSGLEFVLTQIYKRFDEKWGLPSKREDWVRFWAQDLEPSTPTEISEVANFCLSSMPRCPSLPEFLKLVERLRNHESLEAPIVSPQERLAFLILTSSEFAEVDEFHFADACLIAGAALHLKSAQLVPGSTAEGAAAELSGRARMFATEAAHWRSAAMSGQGYWTFFFKPSASSG